MTMTYPEPKNITEHKDEIYRRLLLYFTGHMNLQSVEDAFKALVCDA